METNNIPKIKPEWIVGITMTSEQKAKWLEALRSGDYRQCVGRLRAPEGGYCCLGVAEEIGIARARGVFVLEPGFLGEAKVQSIQSLLADMNDDGATFCEIADFIEANIPACDEVRS